MASLPLPDVSYHLREISTMVREIGDGSSHHEDKLHERFERFKVIWDASDAGGRTSIRATLSALAGVGDIAGQKPAHNGQQWADLGQLRW